MNSLERVVAAIQGQPTDRRAVSLTLSLYGAKLTDCPLRTYYTDPIAYARGQSAVREVLQPDILFGPFSAPLEGAAFGGQVRFFDNQAPNLVRPAISPADGIDRLDAPDLDSHPALLYFREALRLMVAEHGQQVPVAAVALSPVDLPAVILGIDGWLEVLLFDRAGAQRMLALTAPLFVRRVNAFFSEGVAFAVLPANFANPSIVTRQIAAEMMLPMLRESFSQLLGPIVFHSGGAPLSPFLDLFAGLPNVVGFVLNPGENFVEAREKVGPQPVLVGNIDGPSLFMRQYEDVFAECLSVLRDRCDDPHFILGSSAADIGLDTPVENIRAFRRAIEAFAGEEAV